MTMEESWSGRRAVTLHPQKIHVTITHVHESKRRSLKGTPSTTDFADGALPAEKQSKKTETEEPSQVSSKQLPPIIIRMP